MQGVAANGAPYYKSTSRDEYLYYDLDCNGGGDGTARWILDVTAPNASRTSDLDGDGRCNYHARLDSNITSSPPSGEEWQVFCGSSWVSQALFLSPTEHVEEPPEPSNETSNGSHGDAGNHSHNNTSEGHEQGNHSGHGGDENVTDHGEEEKHHPEEHGDGEEGHEAVSSKLVLSGACQEKAYLNSLVFSLEGETASGAPFYKSATLDQYIYWDPACAPSDNPSPRWIIDTGAPNTTRASDLDADGVCDYHARTNSSNSKSLPLNTTWRMYCGSTWKDVALSFQAAPNTTATASTSTVAPAATGGGADAEGYISFSARALGSLLLTQLLVLLPLFFSA